MKHPLRVGYSATIWDHARSGVGICMAEQLAILEKRTDVELCVWGYGGKILAHGERPLDSGTQAGISKKFRPLRDVWWHRRSIGRQLERLGCDVVHIPTVRRLPGRCPCPVVVTVDDLGPVRVAHKYDTLRRLYHQHVLPRWLKNVDAILSPSEATRADLLSLYGVPRERVHVVRYGFDPVLFHPGEPAESAQFLFEHYGIRHPFFVYISRMEHPAKNHLRLIQAFERIRGELGSRFQLVLVGPPWNGFEIIERAAEPLMAGGDLVLPGFVPKSHLPHFLRAATALVFPSLFEGFGLPVIEAMACGTPVACSRASALTEIAEGHAVLFDPLNVDGIASVLKRLAVDETLRKQLSEQGKIHARQFTWPGCVEGMVTVWRQVVGRRQREEPHFPSASAVCR